MRSAAAAAASVLGRGRARSVTARGSSNGSSGSSATLCSVLPAAAATTGLPPLHIKRHDDEQHEQQRSRSRSMSMGLMQREQQHHNHYQLGSSQRRQYSTTPRREILPLIAVGLAAVTVRYSYKALQRMDAEWEEYEEELREYKLRNGLDPDADLPEEDGDGGSNSSSSTSSGSRSKASPASPSTLFKGGTIGIDLGTTNVRISHRPANDPRSHIVVDREGGRATPNAIYFEHDRTAVIGRLASSKLHERPEGVVLNPHRMLQKEGEEEDNMIPAVEEVIRSAAQNALEQALGSRPVRGSALFALDSAVSGGGYDARPIYAYPAPSLGHDATDLYRNRYEAAIRTLSEPAGIASFVMEPVAAILGTVGHGIMSQPKGAVLVLDVGGTTTSASLVVPAASASESSPHGYDVTHSLRLDGLGGETLVDALVSHLCHYFYEQPPSDVKDGMALQRLYDASRAAVLEISGGKDRVQINIPYLSVDEKMQPRHLDVGVGRVVLEHEVKDLLKSRGGMYEEQNVLSASMGKPSDLTSALSSLTMRLLEESGTNPFALEKILIVGGGARSPIVKKAITDALEGLGGPQLVARDKLVIPQGEMVEEVVVLGAAVAGEE